MSRESMRHLRTLAYAGGWRQMGVGVLVGLAALLGAAAVAPAQVDGSAADRPGRPIHSVTDQSHEFTFYFDGRFAANYLDGEGSDVRNWATLHKADLSEVNLLVLQSGASPCPYLPQDIAAVRRFLQAGGGVVVLGDYALFTDEKEYRLNDLARAFGAEFAPEAAREPLKASPALGAAGVRTYGGKTLRLQDPKPWEVLVADADGRPVLARRTVGKGRLLLASRAMAGRQPDAKDPINAEWWRPLLRDLASGTSRDRAPRTSSASAPRGRRAGALMPENVLNREGLRIQCSNYLRPYADAIYRVYQRCRPALERILGVPPSKDMLTSLILLPTGSGGFSDGRSIGLGVWWGGFPKEQYGMVELLGHEATHSWVLPFPEPMWNEGLATYVGIRLARELGLTREADASLRNWLDQARREDPEMTRYDLRDSQTPHVVAMAKPMWIFEQLRKEKPDILARYFQAKRRLIDPARRDRYSADDSVAVLSLAAERDLFPWFCSLGVKVDRAAAVGLASP